MPEKDLVTQPSLAPTRKLQFAMSAGAIVTGIQWAVGTFAPQYSGGFHDPALVSLMTGIIMSVTAYLTRNKA